MGRAKDNWQELQTLDFDAVPFDDPDWWREQDMAMETEELERIELQAEMEELRHNGYGE